MKVITVPCGPFMANMYFVIDEASNQALIIDPVDVSACEEILKGTSLSVCGIFLTHGHFDHANHLQEIVQLTGAASYVHHADLKLLDDPALNASFLHVPKKLGMCDRLLDESRIEIGSFSIQVMHTLGHTQGSVCYLIENGMFSGDTVFADGIGRCDLPGGNYQKMRKSLRRIFSIAEDYRVYPGHGESTSLFTLQPRLKYHL